MEEFNKKMHIWLRSMSLPSNRYLIENVCERKRRKDWEHVIRLVRPVHEVQHIKKNLAVKRVSVKLKLKNELQKKEEESKVLQRDYEQKSQRLGVINVNVLAIKQRTKEFDMKNMLFNCKKKDLEQKIMMYKQLSLVTNLLNQPSTSGSGDYFLPNNKQMETAYQNIIKHAENQIREIHKVYKTNDVNLELIRSKKESLIQSAALGAQNIPVVIIWQTMMNLMNKLNAELRELIQSNIGNKTQQLTSLKKKTDTELLKFMLLYLQFLNSCNSVQQRVSVCKAECDALIDKAVETIKGKFHCAKLSNRSKETSEIKKMLEMEMKIVEFNAMKKIIQNEIANSKLNQQTSRVVELDVEAANKLDARIEELKSDIRINYIWLKKSFSNQSKAYEHLQQHLSGLQKLGSCDEERKANVNVAMKGLKSAVKQEIAEFMDLPLSVFDKLTLPSGARLDRQQQLLKYNLHLAELSNSNELPDILSILNGAPSTSPHSVLLHTLENKLYLNALKSAEFRSNYINTADLMNGTSLQQLENGAIAVISDNIGSLKTSISQYKTITDQAESNYMAWIEQPLQHAVPEKLKLHGQSLRQWQSRYNSLIANIKDEEEIEIFSKI